MEAEPRETSLTSDPPVPRRGGRGIQLRHMMFLVVVFAVITWLLSPVLQGKGASYSAGSVALGLLVLAILCVPALVVGGIVLVFRRRRLRQDGLIWMLSVVISRKMPLAQAVGAFADQYGGWFRARVWLLAKLLNDGTPLPQALDLVPGLVPRDVALMVHAGEQSHIPDRSLKMAATSRLSQRSAWSGALGQIFYLGFVLLQFFIVSNFLMYFVTPRFEAIFRDFGMGLPPTSLFVMQLSHHSFAHWAFPLLPLALMTFLGFLAISALANPGAPPPFLSRLIPRYVTPLILRILALETEGGRPLSEGFKLLERRHPRRWVRQRMVRAHDRVLDGGNPWDALRRVGLLNHSDVAVLDSAQRAGNLPWALRTLADAIERRSRFRIQAWSQFLYPLVLLAIALAVGTFAVAYFGPLAMLIEELSL